MGSGDVVVLVSVSDSQSLGVVLDGPGERPVGLSEVLLRKQLELPVRV